MSSKQERMLIFEYWFRVLVGYDITIKSISQIASDFGDKYEILDKSLSSEYFTIENDTLAFMKGSEYGGDMSVFGAIAADSGYAYHWKVKLFKNPDEKEDYFFINIGIIEADKTEEYKDGNWWSTAGISYFSCGGGIFQFDQATQKSKHHSYGKDFSADSKDVIVDIWLDMKDKYELSFGINGKNFGKAADVKDSLTYRLGVNMCDQSTRIELLSFELR